MGFVSRNSSYPSFRFRRLRQHHWQRSLVAETRLDPSDFVYPVFVHDQKGSVPIASLAGQSRHDLDGLLRVAEQCMEAGIPAIALFPAIDAGLKDLDGSEAFSDTNLVCSAIRAVKERGYDLGILCDVALDPFTSHGQDGIVRNGVILNDETIEALCKQALVQAQAGCDVIAPSDMMDGRIGAIRNALDTHDHQEVMVMSYAAKYASAFYGPFRDAVGSKSDLRGADKRTYQMDPRNKDEALHEVAADLQEGADIVMVKPGLPYLDIIQNVKQIFKVPTFAYQVSGEYAMLKAAGAQGWLDADACMKESLLSLKRAGADAIFSYAALEVLAKES